MKHPINLGYIAPTGAVRLNCGKWRVEEYLKVLLDVPWSTRTGKCSVGKFGYNIVKSQKCSILNENAATDLQPAKVFLVWQALLSYRQQLPSCDLPQE